MDRQTDKVKYKDDVRSMNMKQITKTLSYKETLNFYKKLNEYARLSDTPINKSMALDAVMIDYKRIYN